MPLAECLALRAWAGRSTTPLQVDALSPALCPAGANIGVLAKIESAESVGNLNSILDAVDGAMVARGDLGAELPVEEARSAPHTRNS